MGKIFGEGCNEFLFFCRLFCIKKGGQPSQTGCGAPFERGNKFRQRAEGQWLGGEGGNEGGGSEGVEMTHSLLRTSIPRRVARRGWAKHPLPLCVGKGVGSTCGVWGLPAGALGGGHDSPEEALGHGDAPGGGGGGQPVQEAAGGARAAMEPIFFCDHPGVYA